jgi:DNA-directed RNA polymerase sigma subunit (sigma70/sigma32)
MAERGPATLDQVGAALGLTRERVRQIEGIALRKLRQRINGRAAALLDVVRELDARPPGAGPIDEGEE